jgi:hypothetical protein
MKPEHYRIILTDGTETVHPGNIFYHEILKVIGCTGLDVVTLILGPKPTVMFVDDTGMIDGKPVNAKATALYHARCKPGTVHQIHGHVVIVNDRGD